MFGHIRPSCSRLYGANAVSSMKVTPIWFVFVLAAVARSAEPPTDISAASLSALNGGATVVEIANGAAQFTSPCFIRFELGRDSVAITVKNTTQGPIAPTFSADFFNASGMLVSTIDLSFANEAIVVGDVRVRQMTLNYPDIEGIFKHSTIKLPEEWKQPRFVKITVATAPGAIASEVSRPRPQAVKQQNTRPAIFAEKKFATPNIGPVAVDAKWGNYGAYLQRMIDTIQTQWERILIESRVVPASGTTVTVKFVLDDDGKITRITNVSTTTNEAASHACLSAITDRAPYGPWTDDMKAALGKQQEMTFTFRYQ